MPISKVSDIASVRSWSEPIVPPEILKEIVDHLAALLLRQSPSELNINMKNVALVSRMFLPIARIHLFREVDVSSMHDEDGTRRMSLAKLLENDHHARLVHHVKYTYIEYFEHKFQVPMNEPLRIFVTLPQVHSLTLASKRDETLWLRDNWTRPKGSPPFGWRSLLKGFSQHGSLSTIHISSITRLPLIEILSVRTLMSLTLDNCADDCYERIFQTSNDTDTAATGDPPIPACFNLKTLRIYDHARIPFEIVARCTQVQNLVIGSLLSYPSYPANELLSKLGLSEPGSKLPFSMIETFEVTNGYEVEWPYFGLGAQEQGIPNFPRLQDLSIGLHHDRRRKNQDIYSALHGVFNHLPALERLKLHGSRLMQLDVARWVGSFGNTLKVLSLHWDFQNVGFDEIYGVTVKAAFHALLPLQHPALEDLSLHIQLETGIHYRDDEDLLIYRSLAKSIGSLLAGILGDSCEINLPCLQRVDFKVTMLIYEKPESDESRGERHYLAKAIKVLTRYLRRFDDSGSGRFTFIRDINLYRRCTDYDTEEEGEKQPESKDTKDSVVQDGEDSGDNTADEAIVPQLEDEDSSEGEGEWDDDEVEV